MPTDGRDAPGPRGEAPAYTLRLATIDDASLLAYQRRAMFEATGALAPEDADQLDGAVRRYVERAMPTGTFRAWVIDADGVPVAGGGLQLRTLMPRPGYLHDEPEGLIVSMWTEPEHRRRGLGRRIVTAMLAWCREGGIRRLTLHASNDGRPLYASFGFAETNEMRREQDEAAGSPADAPR